MGLLNAAAQEIVHLKGRHGKWLDDGESLLAHLDDLQGIRLECRCGTCGSRGRATPLGEGKRFSVRCECRSGRVDASRPLVVESLLLALGWGLVCTHCGERPVGDNAPDDLQWTVDCLCTTRIMARAVV